MRLSLQHREPSQRVFADRNDPPLHPAHCLKLSVSHKNADTKQWPHCLSGRSLRRLISRPCRGSAAKPPARATTAASEPWTDIARIDEQSGLRLEIDKEVKETGDHGRSTAHASCRSRCFKSPPRTQTKAHAACRACPSCQSCRSSQT